MIGRVLTFLPQLHRRRRARRGLACALEPLPDDRPVYAIGDVHGMRDLLAGLLDRIEQDARRSGEAALIVLLGDMIDRGEDSAGVLDLLADPLRAANVRCLRGNHEQMMLDFLDDPSPMSGWLELGGFETLLSYGLSLSPAEIDRLPRRRVQQMLAAHIPAPHVAWLRALPYGFRLGGADPWGTILAHAGHRPDRRDDDQPIDELLWGRAGERPAGLPRLVQGHLVVPAPELTESRILVDTGAYRSGCLSAVRIFRQEAPRVLQFP